MHRTRDERAQILIVVDSPESGAQLNQLIARSRGLRCIGTATDQQTGVQMYQRERPQLVVAGPSSPHGHTLNTIQHLTSEPGARVVAVCQDTPKGASLGVEALQRGALDLLCAPVNSARGDLLLRDELCFRIRTLLASGAELKSSPDRPAGLWKTSAPASAVPTNLNGVEQRLFEAERSIVIAAAGIGGPRSFLQCFPAFTNPLPPLVVAQLLPANLTAALAKQLDSNSAIRCKVAENGDVLQPNTAYLTPADQQTVVVRQNGVPTLLVHWDLPQHAGRPRPSVDVLMQSAAIAYGQKCLGLLMTGNGRDGVAGARAITVSGGFVLAQDEESCLASGTVRLARKLNYIDRSVPIQDLPEALASVTPILGRPEISVVRSPLFDPGPLHSCAV